MCCSDHLKTLLRNSLPARNNMQRSKQPRLRAVMLLLIQQARTPQQPHLLMLVPRVADRKKLSSRTLTSLPGNAGSVGMISTIALVKITTLNQGKVCRNAIGSRFLGRLFPLEPRRRVRAKASRPRVVVSLPSHVAGAKLEALTLMNMW